jgi:hypothetical protein
MASAEAQFLCSFNLEGSLAVLRSQKSKRLAPFQSFFELSCQNLIALSRLWQNGLANRSAYFY